MSLCEACPNFNNASRRARTQPYANPVNTYDCGQDTVYHCFELQQPEQTFPRAMATGIIGVDVLYLAGPFIDWHLANARYALTAEKRSAYPLQPTARSPRSELNSMTDNSVIHAGGIEVRNR